MVRLRYIRASVVLASLQLVGSVGVVVEGSVFGGVLLVVAGFWAVRCWLAEKELRDLAKEAPRGY